MDYVTEIKPLLMLDDEVFEIQRTTIEKITSNAAARLLIKLKGVAEAVPDELGYIVLEVSIKRFNRLKNEGMASYGQEGESITYSDDDFAEFSDDIADWISANDDQRNKSGVRFISGYGGGN